jgi:hypothetical protein
MRDQGGSLDERAFSVLVVLPLRYRSCIFATHFPSEETITVVRSSNSGGVVERRVQGPVNQ